MNIDVSQIKELREATGAGVMAAKEALLKAGGDLAKAKEILREQGQAKAGKRAGKSTSAGIVDTYLHMERVGTMVELNCETDFVARTPQFKEFAHELAMQVASMKPEYVGEQYVPKDKLAQVKNDIAGELKKTPVKGGNEDKIIAGKLSKYYQEKCLLSQASIMDPKVTIESKLKELVSKLGENIVISRFVRYELGEGDE